MRMFRSIALSLAMAVGALLGVVSCVVQPALRYLSAACDALANGLDKLDRELAHKFAEDVQFAAGVNSGLQRESHGFRQSSAPAEPAQTATPI